MRLVCETIVDTVARAVAAKENQGIKVEAIYLNSKEWSEWKAINFKNNGADGVVYFFLSIPVYEDNNL